MIRDWSSMIPLAFECSSHKKWLFAPVGHKNYFIRFVLLRSPKSPVFFTIHCSIVASVTSFLLLTRVVKLIAVKDATKTEVRSKFPALQIARESFCTFEVGPIICIELPVTPTSYFHYLWWRLGCWPRQPKGLAEWANFSVCSSHVISVTYYWDCCEGEGIIFGRR